MSTIPYLPDRPFRLLPIFRERVWGRRHLAPYFPDPLSNELIGEAWLTFSENVTSFGFSLGELIQKNPAVLGTALDPQHPGLCPLLVKMLFTSERLSVQVHPDDAYAQKHHNSLGKTEAWYVVASEPPGEVAVGFRKEITPERLRESALSGEIEELLDWRKVQAGDTIYTPAGTVHAIGAGLTVCEIQQNSDITYRLYDYGRPRELHLDHGAAVSHLGPHTEVTNPMPLGPGRDQLVASLFFRIERLRLTSTIRIPAKQQIYLILMCLKGTGTIAGEPFETGQCWFVPAGAQEIELNGAGSEWILSYTSQIPMSIT